MLMKELPKGWKWVKFEDLLDYIQPTKYIVDSTDYNSDYKIPVLTAGKSFIIGYTNEVHGVFDSLPVIIFDDFTTANKYVNFPFKVKSSAMKILKPKKGVNIMFVYYYMQTLRISFDTHKRYWISVFSKLNVPYPPLPVQQAIVSKIEELFSELDKGIENLKTAQAQLKVYRQSVLKWAFEGKLTSPNHDSLDLPDEHDLAMVAEPQEFYGSGKHQGNQENPKNHGADNKGLPEGWKIVSISEIVEKNKHSLKAGPFGSSLKKEFYVPSGYKIYGQEQVIKDDAFYGDYYIDESKYQELKSCKVKPFDILISLVGTVGKVLMLPENCKPGVINPRLVKISLNTQVYLPKFFKYYFESSTVKSFYSGETRGTTMDVLNLGIIKTIPFPLCAINEQYKVIEEIESRLSVADKMEETIQQSLLQAESLRQSILKKAFEGELVK